MKKKLFLILPIIFLFVWSCDEEPVVSEPPTPSKPRPEAVFSQKVDVVTYDGTYYNLCVEWTGEDIIEVKYDLAEKSKFGSDDEVKDWLSVIGARLQESDLSKLQTEGRCEMTLGILNPDTEYELVALATNSQGHTKLCRDTQTTSPKNAFIQKLSLMSDSRDSVAVIVGNYIGSNLIAVKSGVFRADESANFSDNDIINNLTYVFDDVELLFVQNNGTSGYDIYYDNLQEDVEYEVAAYATFMDGTTQLCRDKIITGTE